MSTLKDHKIKFYQEIAQELVNNFLKQETSSDNHAKTAYSEAGFITRIFNETPLSDASSHALYQQLTLCTSPEDLPHEFDLIARALAGQLLDPNEIDLREDLRRCIGTERYDALLRTEMDNLLLRDYVIKAGLLAFSMAATCGFDLHHRDYNRDSTEYSETQTQFINKRIIPLNNYSKNFHGKAVLGSWLSRLLFALFEWLTQPKVEATDKRLHKLDEVLSQAIESSTEQSGLTDELLFELDKLHQQVLDALDVVNTYKTMNAWTPETAKDSLDAVCTQLVTLLHTLSMSHVKTPELNKLHRALVNVDPQLRKQYQLFKKSNSPIDEPTISIDKAPKSSSPEIK